MQDFEHVAAQGGGWDGAEVDLVLASNEVSEKGMKTRVLTLLGGGMVQTLA